MPSFLAGLVGRAPLRTHHQHPRMFRVMVRRKRRSFLKVFTMPAVRARIRPTFNHGITAFSKYFCHAPTVPNARLS